MQERETLLVLYHVGKLSIKGSLIEESGHNVAGVVEDNGNIEIFGGFDDARHVISLMVKFGRDAVRESVVMEISIWWKETFGILGLEIEFEEYLLFLLKNYLEVKQAQHLILESPWFQQGFCQSQCLHL
jgi:hypothetical protein